MENRQLRICDDPTKLSFELIKDITNNFSEELGCGTFGRVFKGVLNGEEIAVKILHFMPEISDTQFQNEFEILKRLRHPNIVRLVGFCNEFQEEVAMYKGKPVICQRIHRALCLEYMPKGSLRKLLSGDIGKTWTIRYKIIKGICEGLKYLREGLEVPIFHFDLKPDNILLDEKMVPKIADFGLSRLIGEGNTIKTMTPLGTIGYLPPEFINNQIISKEYDIYSLGVIIAQIITGIRGYSDIADMDAQELVEHVHENWRKRLQEIRNYASLEADCKQVKICIEIAMNCIEKKRHKRPTIGDILSKFDEMETVEIDTLKPIEKVPRLPPPGFPESTGMLDAVAREVSAFLRIKANWGDLDKARDSLRCVETRVRAWVAAEMDKLHVSDVQVQEWLRRVDELWQDSIDEDYGSLLKFSGLAQCTVHARRRAWIGKRVVDALEEVNKLTDEGSRFKKVGFKPPPPDMMVNHLPHQIDTFGLESMLTRLHDLLNKGDSNIIGVWGQGGIGKTTLLHVFNNDLGKKAGDYQVVIYIEVSNSEAMNTVEIQKTISERLNLPWNEAETVEKRAKFLVKALARKRFVVMLDDVRKKFRLEDVGIPTPDTNNQSKLILTSRYQDVCLQMGARRSLIEMHVLDSDAAWKLFLSKLTPEAWKAVSSNNVVLEHAREIFLVCGGLPLALNIIGTAVARLEGPREWTSAANAINTSMNNIDGVDEMFYRLKYSYDRFTPTQQQCFLYCTLFPEYGSISKEQLIDYWLAEGLLLNDFERGYAIIRSLIAACLLQRSSLTSSKVKMYPVIRHLGLWLVYKTDQRFLVQAGMALDSAPSATEWKEATRISIMSNDIKEVSFSPKCRSLTTLLMQNNPNLNRLSWEFFKFMPSLKVLDLSHTAITSLPECETLVALQHLNLSHTLIAKLPERLWLLKELRHLDLSVTVALEDTLNNCSKLLKLRVLNLFRSRYGIRDVDDLNLDYLKELMFLGITIYAEDVLKKLNKTNPLAKSTYRLNLKYCAEMQSIKISDLNHLVHLEELYVESCYDLNMLVADTAVTTLCLEILTLSVLPSLENVIVAPTPHHFQHIRKLVISRCPKLQDITWVLKLEMLERLAVTHCDGMLKIVEEDNSDKAEAMPDYPSQEQEDDAVAEHSSDEWNVGFLNLRSIVLTDVKKLRSICKPRDFPSLETIRVEDCPNLRSIPLSSMYNCGKLKQVCGSVEWWDKLEWADKEGMEAKFFIPI